LGWSCQKREERGINSSHHHLKRHQQNININVQFFIVLR
jgi:hypothetical protein